MVTISEILKARHVDLQLAAADAVSGVASLAECLQGDSRITNWAEFDKVLRHGAAEGLTVLSCGAALCHARTEGVAEMLMAAGRLVTPLAGEKSGGEAAGPGFGYLFVIGLPPALASEYLRVVGALARTLKQSATVPRIGAATTEEEFVAILSQGELAM